MQTHNRDFKINSKSMVNGPNRGASEFIIKKQHYLQLYASDKHKDLLKWPESLEWTK